MSRAMIQSAVLVVLGILISASTAMPVDASAADGHLWKSYTNVRFQYVICYPADLLVPQGESPNSDGQKFLAKDGAQLLVFGRNNALNESLEDILAHTKARLADAQGRVTYKVLKPNWFVVSGQNGQTIFYAKTRYSHDQFKSFELSYDRSVAEIYQSLIGRIASCFADLAQ
jgi:hypothetical protein